MAAAHGMMCGMQPDLESAAEHEQPPRLRDPEHRVSPKAKRMWAVEAAFGWLIPLVLEILAVSLHWFNGMPAWLWAVIFVVTVLAAGAHLTLMPLIRYRVHRWEAREEAVYTRSGWLNIEWRIAPVSRIQTVDTKRDPIERLFGLASVTVTTASAAGPVRIKGLAHDVAMALSDELTANTAASTGDAT